ncbi:MAG: transglutaminase domain-containing protein [Nitrospirota bacterium]
MRHLYAVRIVSCVVLLFFSWTFGGLMDVAYAIKDSDQLSAVSNKRKRKERQPEEKLQKQLKEMEQILDDPVSNACAKNDKLQEKMAEIAVFDKEIRGKFKETEQRLKNAGLPQKILKRHYDFVNQYEENLEELKSKLNAIGQARTVESEIFALENAKKHIEKLNPPKKYKPVDPNKLPHRTAEPVFKEPRIKKEEFGIERRAEVISKRQKMILIASHGSLAGILPSGSEYPAGDMGAEGREKAGELEGFDGTEWWDSDHPGFPAFELPVFLIAKSAPPVSEDLEETIEVQFTDAITAKAAELENDPLKIYEWVRNNIDFVPTYGSIQGADYCLQTKQCNAIDTASLLIALLRISGIHARYVEGTVEIPIEKVMNWLGGFTDKMEALNLLASAGIPVSGILAGGEVKYARIEHVWVEAWIDYFPYRGSTHQTGQGDTWIHLDASFKQYNYMQGVDIQSAVPFDAQTFINQIQASATINEEEGYVTDVDSLFIDNTMTDYQTQVEDYINTNYPDATVGDVLGKKEIIPQEFPYLLGTLPYRTIVNGAEHAEVPDSLRHKITFEVKKDIHDDLMGTPINITKSLPELAGKKVTLSYSPATPDDEAVINSYLPEPHEDGTPIDPTELPTSLAAYLINLKPELMIDGEVVATGTEIGLGATEEFKMTFMDPAAGADIIFNDIQAGEYLGIGIDPYRISEEQMLAVKANLEATKAKLEAEDFSDMTKDDILGDLLYTTAISYFAEHDVMDYISAQTMGVKAMRLPSETIFSYELSVNKFMNMPLSVSPGGLAMDADRIMTLVKALDADKEKPKQFMLSSGMSGSALEHSVPEQLFSTPENPAEGISAVKALKIANDQGIPIYTINQTNIDTILPQLQTDSGTIADIQNAVNAGKTVTVSRTDITHNGWTGLGYIIIDPLTGAGAYMISGRLAGAMMIIGTLLLLLAGFFLFLTLLLTGATVAAPLLLPILAALLAAFFATVILSIMYLYGGKVGSDFVNCFYGIKVTEVAAKVSFDYMSKFLKSNIVKILGNIINGALMGLSIHNFGQCVNSVLYGNN